MGNNSNVSITEAVMTDGNWREDPGDPVSALLFLFADPHAKYMSSDEVRRQNFKYLCHALWKCIKIFLLCASFYMRKLTTVSELTG